MRCPKCQTKNPDVARFCMNCAAPLILVCPQCGTELPPVAKFCFSCAASLAVSHPAVEEERGAPAPGPSGVERLDEAIQRLVPREFAERLLATRGQVPAERRMVTILFSDVKGSTAMAEDLDPEDVMEIMDGAFNVLIEPIYRYEGTLARLMGDAILAFFGAPIAHEDDPERAIRAALDIVEGAREYSARLAQERGIEGFNVRVGINTGLVVVGEVGSDLRVEYTAMGDAINLAARMEGAAEPGMVLITEDTHRLIAPLFETEALGPIDVKGKAEPVSVYRVLGAKAVRGKVRGIAGLESPLVGREAEFDALKEALERLRAGVGGIVTIVGEAGIGKSRLVAEIRSQVLGPTSDVETDQTSDSGPRTLNWVEGRCLSYGGSIAYLLWLDVLRGLLGASLDDAPATVGERLEERVRALCPERFDEVYPFLARLMSLPLEEGLADQLDDMDGQELKSQTFRAVETLIRCAASERPLVLVCEDLHWADSISIELLEQLLALSDRVPLLLLCVFRPETEHTSWRIRETAARSYRHRHTDVWLDPLSAAESETLVGNLLRLEALPQGLRGRILEHAEGNPFYVEEIIRSLIDQGAIVHDDATGRWEATRDVARIPIPETLHGVLMARIDRLEEETKRVLQMAAVIGRVFLYRILETMAEEEQELDERLLTLQREEMIRERARLPELAYIFKHELTREAAYNGLLRKERRVFHRQVAEALERFLPERVEEQVGLLAHHWERAGDAERATEYLLRAGDRARTLYAHEEAIDFYKRALVFLRQGRDQDLAARTLMKLGLTYHNAFEFQRSCEAYDEGFALLQRAGETRPTELSPAPHALRTAGFEPTTLDPSYAHDGASCVVIGQLFSGLVARTADMAVVPDVARTWEVLEGGRRYVFHLRDDVRWSDGAAVTAGDFEYAWKRALNPATDSPNASLLYDVRGARAYHQGDALDSDTVGVRALDEVTLLVELEGPTGYFLQLLADAVYSAVPRRAVEAHGKQWTEGGNIVTNGPFRLEAWERGDSLALVRNSDYHGRFTGNVQRVELSPVKDWRTVLQMYEADRLEVLDLWTLPAPELDRARQRHAGEQLTIPELATYYMGFDVSRPPFDDPRVRRAFALATDRGTVVDVVLRGYPRPPTGGFIPAGMPGHSPGIGLPHDPRLAQQLLAQAGYPGGRGFPAVDALGSGVFEAAAEFLEPRWAEDLGVGITWEILDWGSFFDRLDKAAPHLFALAWGGDYPDPDSFMRNSGIRRQTGWRDEAYDRLVERARRVMDQEERMRLYRRADTILMEQAPIVPLAYNRSLLLVKPWVRSYPASAMGHYFFQHVVIEPH